jgi:hypothetical protein
VKRLLTSSKVEADELPGRKFDPSTGSILALFGEDARGCREESSHLYPAGEAKFPR